MAVPVLLVRIGEMSCGFPAAAVERVVAMPATTPLPQAPPWVLGAVNVGGRPVAVVDLDGRKMAPRHAYGIEARLVLLQTSRRLLGLAADAVDGVVELDPAAWTTPRLVQPGLDRIAAIASLPEGLLYVHDVEALLDVASELRLGELLPPA